MSIWTTFRNALGLNRVPILYGLSSTDGRTPIPLAVDETTGRVLTTSVVSFTPTSLSTILSGKTAVTTAGTRVQLPTHNIASVTLKALSTNTDLIYVGASSVAASNGYQLSPNDVVSFDLDNTNNVWIDSVVNGEGITWLAVD